MAFVYIREPPADLIELSEHQESTPRTFSSNVLYFLSKEAAFKAFPAIGLSEYIDAYITSQSFIIFSPSISKGLEIPYPKIVLHAIHRTPHNAFDTPCIYMQIEDLNNLALKENGMNGSVPESDTNMVELYISPTDSSTLRDFYTALSDCSSLHPCREQNLGEDINEFSQNHEWITETNNESETLQSFADRIHEREDKEENEAKWRCIE
ncbi:hypothetical protein PNEG_01469 [Pneumocystis murina B123]|uniref:Uncharacterized protein n=1 Tax=Pneumocystis murina (strain B123) TaxID=1069680 RepID=M7NSV8_PNEMU|nr:hypothetical protein PNEG_01469 [Pneumocystis murina B123]EMR10196.1 hypothetical protein PNEG_01469 [Pneumocystis murina B123]